MLLNILYTIIIIIVLYFIWRFLAPYFIRIDHVFYTSGAPGTGKDVMSSNYAIQRYRASIRKYKIQRFMFKMFNKKKLQSLEKPLFYSTIPVLLKWHKKDHKREISKELTIDTILLKKRMPHGSIVYISDINRMIDQWSYKNENVRTHVAEYISMFRHYTKGGYFIANSQGSFQVAKEIRGVFGKIRNNLNFKKFLFIYKIEGRTITMSEDVLNVEQGDADEKNTNRTNVYGFLNPFIRRYDTYAYYGRVHEMEIDKSIHFTTTNTNKYLQLPTAKQESNVCNKENSYKRYFKLEKKALLFYGLGFLFTGLLLTALLKNAIPFILISLVYGLMYIDAIL